MGKCFGIVAEFNPFHNGHALLCRAAREQGAQAIVAVMSGHVVQRGEIAIADKTIRIRAALLGGVDLVLELPLPWAMATAQRFAYGAVSILQQIGIVDTLCFGSECGDMDLLRRAAKAVDSGETDPIIREFLAQGRTYASARQLAVEQLYGQELASCLAAPNNALAIEYLRQAARLEWDIEALTIRRAGSGHDSNTPEGNIASASYLRGFNDPAEWREFVPAAILPIYTEAQQQGVLPIRPDVLELAILSHLRRLSPHDLAALPDLSEGIENRLYKAIRASTSLQELMEKTKTKRYTLARIRRLILAAFLGVTRQDGEGQPPYLHVLGFNATGAALLRDRKGSGLPCHTSLAKLAGQNPHCQRIAHLEATAGDIIRLAAPQKRPCGEDFTASGVYL
jgi:predicted nucleotidyltransferase